MLPDRELREVVARELPGFEPVEQTTPDPSGSRVVSRENGASELSSVAFWGVTNGLRTADFDVQAASIGDLQKEFISSSVDKWRTREKRRNPEAADASDEPNLDVSGFDQVVQVRPKRLRFDQDTPIETKAVTISRGKITGSQG